MEKYLAIASKFEIAGTITEIKPLGPGFINDTFIVKTQEGPKYILQRKNHVVFPDVPGMMNNILMVTEHIKAKVAAAGGDPMREVLTVTKRAAETLTDEEKAQPYSDLYYKDADGKMADCDIQIKVADIDGNETTVIVASEAWRPAVYTKCNGEYTEDDLSQGWTRGAECWLGAVSTMDEMPTHIRVLSSTGKVVYDQTSDVSAFEPARIDMTANAPGQYKVTVEFGGQVFNRTIVKL